MKHFYFLFVCCFLSISTWAQFSPATGTRGVSSPLTPGGIFDTVYDRFGTKYPLIRLAINDTLRASRGASFSQMIVVPTSYCQSGYFQLYLDSACGMDSFMTNPVHQQRLNVMCQVLKDISSFISSPCDTNGQKINIWVKSWVGIPGYALGAGTPFYNVPITTSSPGIVDGNVWITLHSGTDAYTNVAAPLNSTLLGTYYSGTTFFHGMVQFNFNPASNIQWQDTLSSPPNPTQYDFYTIALHEVLHALGFSTLIDTCASCNHGLLSSLPYFTRYDQHLQTQGGTPLIIGNPLYCNPLYDNTFNVSNSYLAPNPSFVYNDSTNCSTAIKYVDAAFTHDVYTPNAWEAGSSLDHLEDECPNASQNNLYFVMSNAQDHGVMKRYLKYEERLVLCDLGYHVDTAFGHSANLNDTSYGGTPCEGTHVAGINDGLDSLFQYTYVTLSGSAVTLNGPGVAHGLLYNDHLADSFTCLEVVSGLGSGTLSAYSGNASTLVTFTPFSSTPHVQLLRYIPVNRTTGEQGNITYVFVFVMDAGCTGTICNFVLNGNFESGNACGRFDDGNTAYVNCWEALSASPDYYSRYCTGGYGWLDTDIPTTETVPSTDTANTNTGSNNHFIGMGSGADYSLPDTFWSEAVQTRMDTGLINGHHYTIRFWGKVATAPPPTFAALAEPILDSNCDIQFLSSPSFISASFFGLEGTIYPLPSNFIGLKDTVIPADNQWHPFALNFTYSGPTGYRMLDIINASYLHRTNYSGSYLKYLFLDNVSLAPYDSSFFNPPDTLTTCDTITNLALYAYPSGGTFSGPGVTVGSSTYGFGPSIVGPGLYTVTYSYTDSFSCTRNLSAQIYVHNINGFLTATANPNPSCVSGTVTLSATGCDTCSWTSSPSTTITCLNARCDSATATVSSTTTFTVTDIDSTHCKSSVQVTLATISASITVYGNVDTVCSGDSVYLLANTGSYLYQWQADTGTGYYNIPAPKGTASTLFAKINGNYRVIVSNLSSTCSTTSSAVHVTVFPTPTTTIHASHTALCANAADSFFAQGGYTDYFWQYRIVGVPNSYNYQDAFSDSATILGFPSAGTWVVDVVVSNGYCSSTSAYDTITVYPQPTAGITPLTPSFCPGDSVELHASLASGNTYQWQHSGTNISGATDSIYWASSAGSYKVIETSSHGCVATSTMITVTANPAPTATISPAGNDTFCTGTTVTLTGGTGTSYHWQAYLGSTWDTISGATNTTYSTSTAGKYRVQVTNSYGCSAYSQADTIAFTPQPTSASISIIYPTSGIACAGDSVSLSGYLFPYGDGIQWQRNDTNISGANTYNYMAGLSGNYRIIIRASNFCYDTTSSVSVTVLPPINVTLSVGKRDTACYSGSHIISAYPRGGGYSYQWQRNNTNIYQGSTYSEADSNLNFGTIPGTYRVIVTSTLNNNCTGTSDTVNVAIQSQALDCPCAMLGPTFTVISSGTYGITGFSSGGRYYVQNDLTITGSGTAHNAYIQVAPSKTIYIDAAASPIFDSCHIFGGCDTNMWLGIVQNYNSTQSAHLTIQNQTLIEDGYGIFIDSPRSYSLVLSVSNSIFNKNGYAISISNDTFSNPNIHYSITGSVFTSRAGIASDYKTWPLTKKLKSIVSSDGYKAPYFLDSAFAPSLTNSGGQGWGINLFEVGRSSPTAGLQIGNGTSTTGNTYLNIFDTLAYGIYSSQSNLTSVNNVFTNCGDGIYAECYVPWSTYFPVGPGGFWGTLNVWNNGSSYNNRFYDCHIGVETNSMWKITAQNTYMTSSHTTTSGDSSNTGYSLVSGFMETLAVQQDTVVNVANGILLKTVIGQPYGSSVLPTSTINGNEIRATLPGNTYDSSVHPNRYVSNAIQVINVLPVDTAFRGNTITIDSNRCMNVYRGIYANNLQSQSVTSRVNNIILVPDVVGFSATQYGIQHAQCTEDTIYENPLVHGYGILNAANKDSVRGYLVSLSTPQISCNWEDNVGKGFEFFGPCNGSQWQTNTMDTNDFGLYINGGYIGSQGNATTPVGDIWDGSTWTSNYNTFVFGGYSASSSTLFVQGSSSSPGFTYPTNNSAYPFPGNQYTPTNGLNINTPGAPLICPRPSHAYYMPVSSNEAVALGQVTSASNTAISMWMAQFQLWQTLQVDSTMAASSPILTEFQTMAASSRFAYITTLENQIANSDLTGASGTIAGACPVANPQYDPVTGVTVADSTGATHIVRNYRKFYKILVKYLDSTMTTADGDSLTVLANLCPLTDGAVVYQARALYCIVFKAPMLFDDGVCNAGLEGKPGRSSTTSVSPNPASYLLSQQAYSLAPNPNNGNMTLMQKIRDEQPVRVEVLNMPGQVIYKGSLLFNGNMAPLNLQGLCPGLYLVQLRDSAGNSFVLKFVMNQ